MKRLFLLTATLLAACAPAPAPVVVPAAPAAGAAAVPASATSVTAIARLGLLAPSGKRLLSGDLTAWAASDVDRVEVTVMKDGVEALPTVRLEGAAIGQSFLLTPLTPGATYSVVGRAYRAGVAIDDFAADPASCTTTFTIPTRGYTMQLDPIRIRFGARPFAGNGSTTLEIGDGAVDDAAATPVIDITP